MIQGFNIIPSKNHWLSGNPSQYAVLFNNFVNEIKLDLHNWGLTSSLYQNMLEQFLTNNSKKIDIRNARYNLNKGTTFNIDENIIEIMEARIINKMLASHTLSQKVKRIHIIIEKFHKYSFISGFLVRNPLYKPFKRLVRLVGEVLLEAGVINQNSYEKIRRVIGWDPKRISNLLHSTSYFVPKPSRIRSLRRKIIAVAGTILTNEKKQRIQNFIDEFLSLADLDVAYYLQNLNQDPKLYLIQDLIDNSYALQQVKSLNSLSKLLFGEYLPNQNVPDSHKSYIRRNFLSPDRVNHRPNLHELFRLLYYISKLTVSDFEGEGVIISNVDLIELKEIAFLKIKTFVFQNPYEKISGSHGSYINSHVDESDELYGLFPTYFREPEYELLLKVWMAAAAYKDNLGLTFNELANIIGQQRSLTWILIRDAYYVGRDTILPLIELIQDFISNRPYQEAYKIDLYYDALIEIGKFINARDIQIQKVDREWYSDIWYKEDTKAYHTIVLLGRNLGFDPLNFITLEKEIFAYGGVGGPHGTIINNFIRHHFRILTDRFGNTYFDRASIYPSDLVLTDLQMHAIYQTFSEDEVVGVLDAFQKLISMHGSGINGHITLQDIYKAIARRVYERWLKSPNFQLRLNEFNHRRDFMHYHGLEAFIEGYYDTVKERFFGVYSIDTMTARVPHDTNLLYKSYYRY